MGISANWDLNFTVQIWSLRDWSPTSSVIMFSTVLSPPVFDELLHPHRHHFCVLDSNPSENKRWLHWLSLVFFWMLWWEMRKSWLIAFRRSKWLMKGALIPVPVAVALRSWGYLWYFQLKGGEGVAVSFQGMWQLPVWPNACNPLGGDSDTDKSLIETQFHWYFISSCCWIRLRQLSDNPKL